MRISHTAVAILGGMLVLSACGKQGFSPKNASVTREDGKYFITDDTGKRWDVTHAREKYGMEPGKFQYGLGPTAIRPILNPEMLTPDEKGYPGDSEDFPVLGVSLNGETRSYPISKLIPTEVANEQFGGDHVAAVY